jgi:segregation and condensation protein B
MNPTALKHILEGALLAHGGPMSLERMQSLFDEQEQPGKRELENALAALQQDLSGRGIELITVSSGYRLQVRQAFMPWVSRLWDEKPARYSRALLETLALIAYRQPITRGDIEDVRGVVVSSNIIKTLLEREWVKIVGFRDVPGRPALYATTPEFLDYFGLKALEELPTLNEIRDLDEANRKQALGDDADARRTPDDDYEFVSEEAVARRGADVLAATAEDLAEAQALVDKVESNLFGRQGDDADSNSQNNKTDNRDPGQKRFGDLIRHLQDPRSTEQPDSDSTDASAAPNPKESDL